MKRRAAAWLALLVVTLNTSWPLIATVGPAPEDPTGTVVCTAHGALAVADRASQLPDPQGPAGRLMPQCAFCPIAPGHAGLHSAADPAWRAPLAVHEAPAEYRPAVVCDVALASLGARAPPV
jgi:Protein of unknown function (DUF2946)